MAFAVMPRQQHLLQTLALWLALAVQAIWAGPKINVLQWNPHWQCFVWDEQDCKGEAERQANEWLAALDLDFANLIEFADPNFTVPSGWTALTAHCDHDLVSLVYNDRRWRADPSPAARADGCLVASFNGSAPDRPFVVQRFERLGSNESTAVSNATVANGTNVTNVTGVVNVPSSVIVIGAHFPHPVTVAGDLPDEQFAILRVPLQAMMNSTGTRDVILIADTNLAANIPSTSIATSIGMPGTDIVSTSLERTCCFDVDFRFTPEFTFDRVIANFGVDMMTKVLIEEPIPAWAQQVKGSSKGAFHKPVQGAILWEHVHVSPRAPGSHHQGLMITLAVALSLGAIGLALLLLWGFAPPRLRGRSGSFRKKDQVLEDSDSDDDDDDSGSEKE